MKTLRILTVAWALAGAACQMNRPAQSDRALEGPVDVTPFGQVMKWEENGRDYGVIWEDARDINRVVVSFSKDSDPPRPQDMRLEYWQSSWPQRRIPRDRPSGSGGSGWLDIGDWFQGKWQEADVNVDVKGRTLTYTFRPVNAMEFPGLKNFAAEYRSTMKLRLASSSPLKRIVGFEAYTDSVWKPLDFEVHWRVPRSKTAQKWSGRIEVFNGHLMRISGLSGQVSVEGKDRFSISSRGGTERIAASIAYARPKGCNSFDETVVSIRTDRDSFSFAASDLVKEKSIFIPDFGVLVRRKGEKATYDSAWAAWQKAKADPKTMDLYSRVLTEKEQTFTRAWADTPAKKPQYVPLSFEGSRQHFRSEPNGEIVCNRNWIKRIRGKDTSRCRWEGDEIRYHFGLPQSRPTKRDLVDGCLPIIVNEWVRDGVRYRQTAFATPFPAITGDRIQADDELMLMMRLELENTTQGEAAGRIEISVADAKGADPLSIPQDGPPSCLRSAKYDAVRIWHLDERNKPAIENGKAVYRRALGPGEKHAIDLCIPFVSSDDPRHAALAFDGHLKQVAEYWRKRIAAGTQIVTPEPMINDYYRAQITHLLINTEREVGGADRYMPKVGTFHYGVFSNESCMMVSDLDRRGYRDPAQWSLDAWLHYQGTVALPGDFSGKDGVFYGDGGYEMGEYNQHHGWVLWCMGEHYWYTRDKQWLDRAAPGIVKGCQWVIQQRQRTIDEATRTPIRAIERGLLPPGRLEDIGDWRCWLSTNAFTWWGMDNAARALEAAGHPGGKRLMAEAKACHDDLIAAFTEAMVRSPVVKLRDGSWIPKVPSDVHRRGRSFGWITETLEGAIHLVRCGAVAPNSRLATWIIRDFEDNLYLSEQFGYELKGEEFEKRWFSHGGISQQANLLHNPIPYLLRDEPEHFLRAYFNAFAVSYFPDTRMMTEHALPNIGDWRGDHYKSSDEANSTCWLRLMFVEERGDELWLGAAIPRYWLTDGNRIGISNAQTYFGPVSMSMESNVSAGKITMIIDPPTRDAPKTIRARFRHPDGAKMTRCEVNGAAYAKFDPKKEWVELSDLAKKTTVTAYYEKQ